jgi:transposase
MLTLPRSVRIYLAAQPTDMRAGHDSLFAIVHHVWQRDPYLGHLFVFYGRRKDRVKILFMERGGLVLYYKRLERGHFRIPTPPADATTMDLDGVELSLLLDGIDLRTVHRPALWAPPPRVQGP